MKAGGPAGMMQGYSGHCQVRAHRSWPFTAWVGQDSAWNRQHLQAPAYVGASCIAEGGGQGV